jgi:tRNA(adenine34) deaminase
MLPDELENFWMRRAIEWGRRSPQKPFGAVIVDIETNTELAAGVNTTEESPLWHGEIVAIRNLPPRYRAADRHLTLYTTAEPCVMCQGAIHWAGIERVVFGVTVPDLVRLGWHQFTLRACDIAHAWPHRPCELIGPALHAECLALFENR